MKLSALIFALVLLTHFSVCDCLAQEAESDSAKLAERAESQRRREYLTNEAHQYTLSLSSNGQSFELTKNAILNYSNPVRERGSTHGATLLWRDGKRPIAIGSFSIRRPNDSVSYEFVSLNDTELECHRDATLVWRPPNRGKAPQPMPGAPQPASRANQRLVQMRSLARQFSARCYRRRTNEVNELRLLPQPLYRYEDSTRGVIDGTLFAFVISNDPELLLHLEAVDEQNGQPPVWKYSFARMTSLRIETYLERKKVWQKENFYEGGRSNKKPYLEGGLPAYRPVAQSQ